MKRRMILVISRSKDDWPEHQQSQKQLEIRLNRIYFDSPLLSIDGKDARSSEVWDARTNNCNISFALHISARRTKSNIEIPWGFSFEFLLLHRWLKITGLESVQKHIERFPANNMSWVTFSPSLDEAHLAKVKFQRLLPSSKFNTGRTMLAMNVYCGPLRPLVADLRNLLSLYNLDYIIPCGYDHIVRTLLIQLNWTSLVRYMKKRS